MAKLFNITLPTDSAPLKLRPGQKATVQYTVTNLSGRKVRGRVTLKPDDPAVKNNWVKPPVEAEQDFDDKAGTFQFKVGVELPANATPGKYTFRLDAVNAEIPDEGDTGPTCSFEVLAVPVNKMPGWIIPVAAVVVLLIIGGVVFAIMHKPSKPDDNTGLVAMPNEVGKNAADASDELTKLHFTVTVTSKPASAEQANKVISQSVDQDTKVDPLKTSVALVVGSPALRVPSLIGMSYADAMARLSQQQFRNVTSENKPVTNVNPGFVSAQTPDAGADVQADVAIHLTVAAQLITVPQVTGMAFGNAVLRLRQASLDYGNVTGVQADGIVQAQSPAPNAQVPVGTKVNLALPGCGLSPTINPLYRCAYIPVTVTNSALQRNSTVFNQIIAPSTLGKPPLKPF
jgi:beta-lactam-binding protein with PASTA domain